MELEKGIQLLQVERSKQLSKGYDLHNDLKYFAEELIDASICYLGQGSQNSIYIDEIYPWHEETFQPSKNIDSFQARKEDIIKAGAMIVGHLTTLQHLQDTAEELRKDVPNLQGRKVYFKLAKKMYYGVVKNQVMVGSKVINFVDTIRCFHGQETPAEFDSIELDCNEIWTFI